MTLRVLTQYLRDPALRGEFEFLFSLIDLLRFDLENFRKKDL